MRDVVASLSALAVSIEDGDITDVDRHCARRRRRSRTAFERGASDEEIKKLTQDLRAALGSFLRRSSNSSATMSRHSRRRSVPMPR